MCFVHSPRIETQRTVESYVMPLEKKKKKKGKETALSEEKLGVS